MVPSSLEGRRPARPGREHRGGRNSPGTESLQGQVINNVIGDTSSSTSASTTGAGIGVNQQSTSNVRVRLNGNTIKGVATFGITVQMGNLTTAATNMDAIVQNNKHRAHECRHGLARHLSQLRYDEHTNAGRRGHVLRRRQR